MDILLNLLYSSALTLILKLILIIITAKTAAAGRRCGGSRLVAPQPCHPVPEPALDRGCVCGQLFAGRAVLGAVEVRGRARPAAPCGHGGGAHRHRVCGQPAVHPRCAVQLGQLHGGGAHPAAGGRQPSGMAAVFEPPAGRAPARRGQPRPQPPRDDRGRGRGRGLGHQRVQDQQAVRPPGAGRGR